MTNHKTPMFRLKKPCENCPFKKSTGGNFGLPRARLEEIFAAPAFQCHKTVDYSSDDGEPLHGYFPAQCAGLMALHHKEGKQNQIMQVAQRLVGYNSAILDGRDVFDTYDQCIEAHTNYSGRS